MAMILSAIQQCAVVITATCVTIGLFMIGRDLPLHHYLWNWTEEQGVSMVRDL